jgi:excisionase family DNA binding protein
MEKVYTTEELAEILTVKAQTIRMWTCKKRVPFVKYGSLVRFTQSQVDEIIKNGVPPIEK